MKVVRLGFFRVYYIGIQQGMLREMTSLFLQKATQPFIKNIKAVNQVVTEDLTDVV
jgi:hypothetical protein